MSYTFIIRLSNYITKQHKFIEINKNTIKHDNVDPILSIFDKYGLFISM
jgi:hypothetical protein